MQRLGWCVGCKRVGGSESPWVGNGHGPCGIWPFGKGSPSTADQSHMENSDLFPQSLECFVCVAGGECFIGFV